MFYVHALWPNEVSYNGYLYIPKWGDILPRGASAPLCPPPQMKPWHCTLYDIRTQKLRSTLHMI